MTDINQSVGWAGGMITGGGQNPLAGVYGMSADHVVAFQVVTANGRFITVSEASNPDLFWALRGADGKFGIVVEAVYQVTVLTAKNVVNFDYACSTNDTGAIIDYLASFGPNMLAKLSLIVEALYNKEAYGGVSDP